MFGLITFLIADGMTFAGFFAAYLTYKAVNPLPDGAIYELELPIPTLKVQNEIVQNISEEISLVEKNQLILDTLKIKRLIVPVPLSFENFIAFMMLPLPSPLITFDQVKLLRKDNVISKTEYNLEKLGIEPSSPKNIISTYIS